MPIPKSSTAASRLGRQSALKLFTDRDHERELLRNFFERLARVDRERDVRPERPILSLWGVGGIGKTSLLKKAVEELGKDLAGLRLISLDLDHDSWAPSSPVATFFWLLRSRLWEAKARGTAGGRGIETPLFDCLYFALWRAQHPGRRFDLSDSVLKDLLSTSTQGSNLLAEAAAKLASGVSDVATAGAAAGGLVLLLDKGLGLLRNRDRTDSLSKRGFNIEAMTVKEMEAALAPMLAADVEQWLVDHLNDAICIALDGFERIQSTSLAEDIQKFLADWCGPLTDPYAPFAGRFGCAFLGRNKNRWDELYDKEWHERIKEHRVGGIAEADARRFLESAAAHHENHEDPTTADNLRKHADEILAVTREQRSQDGPFSFHPYYLDLAYGILNDRGVHFQPADLGETPAELQIRFLRYLQIGHPDAFDAFRCLALAGSFDAELFKHLVERGCIAAGLHFTVITGEDYSYVEEIRDMPGTFRFHRLMELALIKNQSAKAEDRTVARQHIDVILDYFKNRAAFSKLADCTPSHLSAYQRGMTVAFDRHDEGLFDFASLNVLFSALEKPFDSKAFVSVRIGWWSKLCELQQRHHAKDHRDVASSLNTLARLYDTQGQYAKAEPLYQRALGIFEKALGPEHADMAKSLINLAWLYHEQGQYAKAEPLYQRALAISEKALGAEHPDVADSLDMLAILYDNQGQYAKAEPLYQRALGIFERALDPEHPNVANGLNNLAVLYDNQGQYAKAEPLYQRALGIFERALGPEHPDVAMSLDNLAGLYETQGQYAEAELLHQRSLAILEKALGAEHPSVARIVNNLAILYETQGQYAKAESLHQRALGIFKKALGPEHPNVANSLNNLAALYDSQDQYAKAEPLYQRALAIREKALGPEHPDVANSLNNLAALYDSQGQHVKTEPLYQRSLAILEKALGPEHPDVANSLNNLAMLYDTQHQYAKAEPLYRRALAIREKALGPEHPDVATCLKNYALLLRAMGRSMDAAALETRARAIRAKNA